jgi:hypothetical protein
MSLFTKPKSEKIAPEAADIEIDGICEALGAKLKGDEREVVRRALVEGRLVFDTGKSFFTYKLKAPIEREKSTITEVTLREPTGGQLRDATKGKRDEMEASLLLIGYITGQPIAIVEELKQRDIGVLAACLGFFG